jgi:uracil-DNA glycosylase
MIPKPSGCVGCPLAHHGAYFTPDSIPAHAEVLFLAQNPGPDEEAGLQLVKRHYQHTHQYFDEKVQVQPQPLIGATGQLFDKRFLPLSGLTRSEVGVANAIRCRPGTSLGLRADALPGLSSAVKLETSDAEIVKALKHCRDAYLHIPTSVKTIVTMGRYAMFALTGIQSEESEYGRKQGVIESWRGYGVNVNGFDHFRTVDTSVYHDLASEHRIFFTMHIAALFHGDNKRYFHATLEDFNRLKHLLNRAWPGPLPNWQHLPPTTWPKFSAFDTEYDTSDNDRLIRWSLTNMQNVSENYCVEAADTSDEGIAITEDSTVLLQNAHADMLHLANIVDFTKITLHDMMLAHSVLWPGEPHNLNYIQSKYGSLNRYKHLSKALPQLYSTCDSFQPATMWRHHFVPQFKADTDSWNVYKNIRLQLINPIAKAHRTGARVDTVRLTEVCNTLEERVAGYIARAQEITGNDKFKLSSIKSMREVMYGR